MQYDGQLQAEGRIKVAIGRMAAKYVFHVKIIERFVLCERTSVATMGVAATGADVLLVYNIDFVLSLPADQLAGVLLHEVHHVLFGHIFRDLAQFPDEWARIVAEEVTVNEFVPEPLPDGVIRLDQFPQLPRMESTDKRYDRLKRRKRRLKLTKPDQWAITGKGNAEGEGLVEGQSCQEGNDGRGEGAKIVDDHSIWEEASADRKRAEAVVAGIIQDAVIEIGRENVPEELRGALRRWGVGDQPGNDSELLSGKKRRSLQWQRLLRRYIGEKLEPRPVFNRPPRRFPDLVGILPGRRRQCGRVGVMAVIDTSGSIDTETLELISAELRGLARHYEVTVVECDCQVQNVYRFRPIESVTGRGGTDFRPPLVRSFLRQHRADLVVYFTDGFGPPPDRAPPVPVIWCLVPGGEPPADWGRVIRMHTPD